MQIRKKQNKLYMMQFIINYCKFYTFYTLLNKK